MVKGRYGNSPPGVFNLSVEGLTWGGNIPIIGPAIAPVIALIAIPVGILIGAKLDVDARKNGGSLEIVEELIRLAHDFFKLLIDAFKAVFPQTT